MSEVILRNVRRAYNGAWALDDVSLTAPDGNVLALLGPSGSGKSTILRLIAGLEAPDAGEVVIGDETVSGPGRLVATEARRVGMVFQDYSLFPHLTAGANVAFGLNKLSRADRDAQALAWLDPMPRIHPATLLTQSNPAPSGKKAMNVRNTTGQSSCAGSNQISPTKDVRIATQHQPFTVISVRNA
jgi:ABC-type sugar transport system ATPase subunit